MWLVRTSTGETGWDIFGECLFLFRKILNSATNIEENCTVAKWSNNRTRRVLQCERLNDKHGTHARTMKSHSSTIEPQLVSAELTVFPPPTKKLFFSFYRTHQPSSRDVYYVLFGASDHFFFHTANRKENLKTPGPEKGQKKVFFFKGLILLLYFWSTLKALGQSESVVPFFFLFFKVLDLKFKHISSDLFRRNFVSPYYFDTVGQCYCTYSLTCFHPALHFPLIIIFFFFYFIYCTWGLDRWRLHCWHVSICVSFTCCSAISEVSAGGRASGLLHVLPPWSCDMDIPLSPLHDNWKPVLRECYIAPCAHTLVPVQRRGTIQTN